MTNLDRSDGDDLLSALRHPLRRRILRTMGKRKEAISPRELATALEMPLSNVSYHVRVLSDCSAVTLVKTKAVRGSMQHFYRVSIDEPWALEVLRLEEKEDGDAGKGGGKDSGS